MKKIISFTLLIVAATLFCAVHADPAAEYGTIRTETVSSTSFRTTQEARCFHNGEMLKFYFYTNGQYSFSSDNLRISGEYTLVDQNTGIKFDYQISPSFARVSLTSSGSLRSMKWNNLVFTGYTNGKMN